jgi:hypothetical protein
LRQLIGDLLQCLVINRIARFQASRRGDLSIAVAMRTGSVYFGDDKRCRRGLRARSETSREDGKGKAN